LPGEEKKPFIDQKGEMPAPDPAADKPFNSHFPAAAEAPKIQLSAKQILYDSFKGI